MTRRPTRAALLSRRIAIAACLSHSVAPWVWAPPRVESWRGAEAFSVEVLDFALREIDARPFPPPEVRALLDAQARGVASAFSRLFVNPRGLL